MATVVTSAIGVATAFKGGHPLSACSGTDFSWIEWTTSESEESFSVHGDYGGMVPDGGGSSAEGNGTWPSVPVCSWMVLWSSSVPGLARALAEGGLMGLFLRSAPLLPQKFWERRGVEWSCRSSSL